MYCIFILLNPKKVLKCNITEYNLKFYKQSSTKTTKHTTAQVTINVNHTHRKLALKNCYKLNTVFHFFFFC